MSQFTPQQIEEFLQEFFNVVGTRQYIGARYVPLFGRKGEQSISWDNSAPYEPLTVVLHQGNSYTSRQYVPAGVAIDNQDYWAETANYNAQVEQYRQEVLQYKADTEDMIEDYVSDVDSMTASVRHQLKQRPDRHMIVAHQGNYNGSGGGYQTVQAFRDAVALGYDAIECDCHMTSDGYFVLRHDSAIPNVGNIESLTLSEVRAYSWTSTVYGEGMKIPTLDEYAKICKDGNVVPFVELVGHTYTSDEIKSVLEILDKYNLRYKAVIICKYEGFLDRTLGVDDAVTCMYIPNTNGTLRATTQADVNMCVSHGFSGVHFDVSTIDSSVVAYARQCGIQTFCGAITTSTTVTNVMLGCDFVGTNDIILCAPSTVDSNYPSVLDVLTPIGYTKNGLPLLTRYETQADRSNSFICRSFAAAMTDFNQNFYLGNKHHAQSTEMLPIKKGDIFLCRYSDEIQMNFYVFGDDISFTQTSTPNLPTSGRFAYAYNVPNTGVVQFLKHGLNASNTSLNNYHLKLMNDALIKKVGNIYDDCRMQLGTTTNNVAYSATNNFETLTGGQMIIDRLFKKGEYLRVAPLDGFTAKILEFNADGTPNLFESNHNYHNPYTDLASGGDLTAYNANSEYFQVSIIRTGANYNNDTILQVYDALMKYRW